MSATEKLFTEKLRPKTWDNMILLPRVRAELEKGLIQNVFLYSSTPGSGKSSASRILTEGHDTLKLNGSSENGIDVIREQVVQFASSVSLIDGEEKIKAIYIDEADGLSPQAWDALRETIERYADTVRFVCTCNRIDKIPDPIKSRFNCIPFYAINKEEENLLFEGYVGYVARIAGEGCKMTFTDEGLRAFVKEFFPDMRSILNTLQSLKIQGITELDGHSAAKSFDYSDLFNLILTGQNPIDNYLYVMANYASKADDALLAISGQFIDYIRVSQQEYLASYGPRIPYMIICIAEHVNQMTSSPDKVIVLLSCIFKLQTILHS